MAAEEAALLGRHAAELAAFEAGAGEAGGPAPATGAAAAGPLAAAGPAGPAGPAGSAAAAGPGPGAGGEGAGAAVPGAGGKGSGKPSRAQKRREQRAREEREREERIAAELEALGETERMEEERLLAERLAGMGLRVSEVKADGHCLFRAVGEQCCPGEGGEGYWALRKRAVGFMRSHPADFLPFAAGVMEQAERSGQTAEEAFAQYCDRMETTAEWGGSWSCRPWHGPSGRASASSAPTCRPSRWRAARRRTRPPDQWLRWPSCGTPTALGITTTARSPCRP